MKLCDAVVANDGQLLVPKEILEELGAKPGDGFRFLLADDGRLIVRLGEISLFDLAGIFYEEGRPTVPIEAMSPWTS